MAQTNVYQQTLPPPDIRVIVADAAVVPSVSRARLFRRLRYLELSLSVLLTVQALAQLVLLNAANIGFAIFWLVPFLNALGFSVRKKTKPATRTLLTAYLVCLSIGTWIGPVHSVLPGLGFGGNMGAAWNMAPITARRIITWCVATSVSFVLFFGVYLLFVRPWLYLKKGRLRTVMCTFSLPFAVLMWGGLVILDIALLFTVMKK